MNAYSIKEDQLIFTNFIMARKKCPYTKAELDEYINEDMKVKYMWLKYMRIIYKNQEQILFDYHNPYKSECLSKVTELSVYNDVVYNYGEQFSSRICAEVQGYIANFCQYRIMSPDNLVNTLNNILENNIESYNHIYNDDAKFILNNFNMVSTQSKHLTFAFTTAFLFTALLRKPVLRETKIDNLLS